MASPLSKQIALLEDELGLKLFFTAATAQWGRPPAGSLFRGEMEKVGTMTEPSTGHAM